MNVCLLSMFSSSTGYLKRYFGQLTALHEALRFEGHRLRLVLCEGDSTDDTWGALQRYTTTCGIEAFLMRHHHGNTVYGSVEEPQRFRQLSRIWNEMLEKVHPSDEQVIIVESDLIWDADTMMQLIWSSLSLGGVVAPMVMEGQGRFHDVWAYRRDGERFRNEPPYHRDLTLFAGGAMPMDSVGSCLAMPAEVAQTCRTTESEELVGFCNNARASGYKIYCDTGLRIQHPPTGQAGCGCVTGRAVGEVRV